MSKALHIQAAEYIRSRILSGQYPLGSQIPTENELAALLGISRPTVRQALDSLSNEGYLQRIKGKGDFCDPAQGNPRIYHFPHRLSGRKPQTRPYPAHRSAGTGFGARLRPGGGGLRAPRQFQSDPAHPPALFGRATTKMLLWCIQCCMCPTGCFRIWKPWILPTLLFTISWLPGGWK